MPEARRNKLASLENEPEARLVALARAGDEAAVRELIARHNQQLFRVARGMVRDDMEAEDIVQETYVRAFTGLERFRGESALSTWLTRIAINEALGRKRHAHTRQKYESRSSGQPYQEDRLLMFPYAEQPQTPEAEAARREIRQVLEQAVDRLPDHFRLVFILRDIDGLTTNETAERLGVKPQTVKTRLHRARKLMQKHVADAMAPCLGELFPFAGLRCANMADRVVARLAGFQTP